MVLDPGHGGVEEGAKGPGGLRERRDARAHEDDSGSPPAPRLPGGDVTRASDADGRSRRSRRTANAAKADVFLSLHCNASRAPTAHGTEVYYLSLDASDRAAALLAESENAPRCDAEHGRQERSRSRSRPHPLGPRAESASVGVRAARGDRPGRLQPAARGQTRGVKQAPFRVLVGVNAPAVLVEVAFITNPDEETRIGSDEFRRQVGRHARGKRRHVFPDRRRRRARAVRAPRSSGKS